MHRLVEMLVIVPPPWVAAIPFVRAVRAAHRRTWRSAATSARTSTLLQVTITFGYMFVTTRDFIDNVLGDLVNMPPVWSLAGFWALGNVLLLTSLMLSMTLAVLSSVLWFTGVLLEGSAAGTS